MEEFYLLWELSRRPEISQTITDLAILNQLVMSDRQQTVVAKIGMLKFGYSASMLVPKCSEISPKGLTKDNNMTVRR